RAAGGHLLGLGRAIGDMLGLGGTVVFVVGLRRAGGWGSRLVGSRGGGLVGLRRGGGELVGPLPLERLVGGQAAVARARQRRVRAAPAVGKDCVAATRGFLLLVAVFGLLGGELGLRADVDPPPGE